MKTGVDLQIENIDKYINALEIEVEKLKLKLNTRKR